MPAEIQRFVNDYKMAMDKRKQVAEGIDQAASAFERAIDPSPRRQDAADAAGATRQRGRFAQVAEKPEPLFEMRIVEGDPETGDTRDGGDDPRLRAAGKGHCRWPV